MKNKRGDTIIGAAVNWINLLLVILVAGFMVMVAIRFINEKYETHYLESRMFYESLVYDKDCLAYYDGFKTHIGIIDFNRFSKINQCYSRPNLGYSVSLFDLKDNKLNFVSSESKLNDILPICSSLPDYKCSTKKNYITYFKDNKLNNGFLVIEVITIE